MKNEETKKSYLIRNILVVLMFALASLGTSTAAFQFIHRNLIENMFASVTLGILVGTGFMYLFVTIVLGGKIIK